MNAGIVLAILLGNLPVAVGVALAQSAPLVVMSDDTHVPDNPESEAFRFHGGRLTGNLRFDADAPSMKLVGVDATCDGRRKSFVISGDYYAYWNNRTARSVWIGAAGSSVRALVNP